MTRPATDRRTPMFRRLGPGEPVTLDTIRGRVTLAPGDWLEASAQHALAPDARRRLGPVVPARRMERDTGTRIDDGQIVVRSCDPLPARAKAAPASDAPTVGVAVVPSGRDPVDGVDLAECAITARLCAESAHCPVLTATGPQAIGALRSTGVAWIAVVPQGFDAGTGWLARAFDRPDADLEDAVICAMAQDAPPVLIRTAAVPRCTVGHAVGDTPDDVRQSIRALLDIAPFDFVCVTAPNMSQQHMPMCDAWSDATIRAMLATGAPAAVPVHNIGEPCPLPTVTDDSPLPRLPGGRGTVDIDLALRALAHAPIPGIPARPAAIVLRRDIAEAVARGERPDVTGAVVATDAYIWTDRETDHIASLVDTGGGRTDAAWVPFADRARRAVAVSRPRGLPVALYSSNVGPWGGVAVLLRLADELQDLGIAAAVVHHTTTEHRMRPATAPLKVRNAGALLADWPGAVGWRDGILVGSHWGSGRGAREIAERNPGIVLTSFLQDREDLFEEPAGTQAGAAKYAEYLKIGRGVSVSRWIIDTAAEELGLDPTHYRVISPGVDCSTFRPRVGPRPPGPVRILAMWRPQTAVRRGIALLREVYDATHRRYGDAVSLEVFGWNDRSGPGRAPDYVRHHGHLSPAQVAALMAEADIVVEPSVIQGHGLPGMEAMACGAALASTQNGGIDTYGRHEENALVVPHAGLADAVARLVEDAPLRAMLQAAGPETARRYDWPLVGARWALYLADLWEAQGGAAVHREALARAVERARGVVG